MFVVNVIVTDWSLFCLGNNEMIQQLLQTSEYSANLIHQGQNRSDLLPPIWVGRSFLQGWVASNGWNSHSWRPLLLVCCHLPARVSTVKTIPLYIWLSKISRRMWPIAGNALTREQLGMGCVYLVVNQVLPGRSNIGSNMDFDKYFVLYLIILFIGLLVMR